jgi:hypothetical protein
VAPTYRHRIPSALVEPIRYSHSNRLDAARENLIEPTLAEGRPKSARSGSSFREAAGLAGEAQKGSMPSRPLVVSASTWVSRVAFVVGITRCRMRMLRQRLALFDHLTRPQ